MSLFNYDHEKVWVIGILNSTTWPTTAEERKLAEKANRDLTRIKRKIAMKMSGKGATNLVVTETEAKI